VSIEHYLPPDPKDWDVCKLFKAGAIDTWERIKFTRSINRLKILETTITQNLVYEFKLLQEKYRLRGFRLYESRDEKANGSDLMLWVQRDDKIIRYALQAKIIYQKKKKLYDGHYQQLEHIVKKSGEAQVDLILKYGRTHKCIPLYLLYNYVTRVLPSVTQMSHYGCSIVTAQFLKNNHTKLGSADLKNDVLFSELHANPSSKTQPAFPWHELVCNLSKELEDIIIYESPNNLHILSTRLQDLAIDENWIELSSRKQTESGKRRAFNERTNQEEVFNPKYMFFANLDENSIQ